ncbi:MAG: hypothetical protein U1E60_19000 [Reyranellaceae bacterium]
MIDRAELVAIAARDVCRAIIVLDRLAEGPATNDELRKAAGWPGDSFRSLLRRMARDGMIEAAPSRRWRRPAAVAVAAGLLVAACAGPDVWERAGATQSDFQKDSYECERDARMSAASFGAGIAASLNARDFYRRCLTAHGYTLRPK